MTFLLYRMYHIVEIVNSKEVEVVHSNCLKGGESFWPLLYLLQSCVGQLKMG